MVMCNNKPRAAALQQRGADLRISKRLITVSMLEWILFQIIVTRINTYCGLSWLRTGSKYCWFSKSTDVRDMLLKYGSVQTVLG